MQTPRAVEIQCKVDKLSDKFENYLRLLFDEWKRDVPGQIRENIVKPLFTINSDKKIGQNFAKEVMLCFVFTYLFLDVH